MAVDFEVGIHRNRELGTTAETVAKHKHCYDICPKCGSAKRKISNACSPCWAAGIKIARQNAFWPKVNKTDTCWLWTAELNNKGYGVHYEKHKSKIYAHRYSWKIHFGAIPVGLKILHKCDTPACVNPSHLFLGTQKDNMDDMYRKGRNRCNPPKGEGCSQSKLTESQVLSIRKSSAGLKELGEQFSVSRHTIWVIRTRRTWKHV